MRQAKVGIIHNLQMKKKIDFSKRVRSDQLTVTYLAKSKENRKIEKYIVIPDHKKLALFEVEKRAKKRAEFKSFFVTPFWRENSDKKSGFFFCTSQIFFLHKI